MRDEGSRLHSIGYSTGRSIVELDGTWRVLWVRHVGLLTKRAHTLVLANVAREVGAGVARAVVSDFRQVVVAHDLSASRIDPDGTFARTPVALLVNESGVELFRSFVVDSVRRGSVRGIFTDACRAFAWARQMAALLALGQRAPGSGEPAG